MRRVSFTGWPEEYAAKLVAAEDAVQQIRSGDTVVIPIGVRAPALSEALFARRDEIRDVHILACAPATDPGWFTPGDPSFTTDIEVFSVATSRESVVAHRSGFVSVPFSRRFKGEDEPSRTPARAADVVFLSVSPPDRFGFCSLGLSLWNKLGYARRARTVLAEVHSDYPRTGGANQIHVGEIDAFVEAGAMPPPPARDLPPLPDGIVGHIAELIRDGDTVQFGTGMVSARLLTAGVLEGKEAIGMHTEITVPGLPALVRDGVIDGSRKSRHAGKVVTTQLTAQTPEEIDFVHENPVFELYEVDYTNDIGVIASHDNMVAVNNAVAVDLLGQIAAESIGADLWSGPGGQPEFHMGAMMSRGGRAITVLPSTARGGEVSRISAALEPGTVVTVPRQFADYVVTEYGMASLYGKSDRERAQELISIAHPDHRPELRRAAGSLLGG